jgi:hypothetical protein
MNNLLRFPHEATVNDSSSQAASAPHLRTDFRRIASTVAGAIRHFLDRFFELLTPVALPGVIDMKASRSRWRRCPTCPEIHNGWHRCPNRLIGFCADCNRRRLLDQYARCPLGHRVIAGITLRTSRYRGGDRPA